jgi:phosphoserine aminotransferase
VGHLREALAELFAVPDGYEVLLGNGGASLMWDAIAFGLIERRSSHAVAGEFGQLFATAVAQAPFVDQPLTVHAEPGQAAWPVSGLEPGQASSPAVPDVIAWTHNETSTGVMVPVLRPASAQVGQLTVVDGTSAAGGVVFDAAQADLYYFSPQKNFGSDGGLWFALASPAAIERIERLAQAGRWVPRSLSLADAITQSRLNQTVNTPALANLVMTTDQVDWLLANGGLKWADQRTRAASDILYRWAENRADAEPFVSDPAVRSQVVVTIDFAATVDAKALAAALRANGIVDTEPYRKLGRNQLRIATFASRDPEDVQRLTGCLDWLLERLPTLHQPG